MSEENKRKGLFVKGHDVRRLNVRQQQLLTHHPTYMKLRAAGREALGQKIIEFGSLNKRALEKVVTNPDTPLLELFVANLWAVASTDGGSPADRKLIFAAHGVPTESKTTDITSSDGALQNAATAAMALGATLVDVASLSDELLMKIRGEHEDANSQAIDGEFTSDEDHSGEPEDE